MPAGVRLLHLLLYSECGKIEKQIVGRTERLWLGDFRL